MNGVIGDHLEEILQKVEEVWAQRKQKRQKTPQLEAMDDQKDPRNFEYRANMVDERWHPFACPSCGYKMQLKVSARTRKKKSSESDVCRRTAVQSVGRTYITERYAVKMEHMAQILAEFEVDSSVVIDAFSDDKNHRFDRWYTAEQDALKQDWAGKVMWLNPPWSVWPQAAEKVL